MQESDSAPRLPEANEFSPGQVNLRRVLELAKQFGPNRDAVIEAIREEYFSTAAATRADPKARLAQQRTRAYNVLIGMKGYGLFDFQTNTLTPLGQSLLSTQDDDDLYKSFARHILRDRHGTAVLQAVKDIQARNESVTKTSLAIELRRNGFSLPRATTHHTKMVQWLRKAGIVDDHYKIDGDLFASLAGISLGALGELSSLNREQRAFLHTLRQQAETAGTGYLAAKDLVDLCEYQYGRLFKDDQLRAKVFKPLERLGWLTLKLASSGRGGKSGQIAATQKLIDVDLSRLKPEAQWGIPSDLKDKLNTPLPKIYVDLQSTDKTIKGIALELLAVRMAVDLGLVPLQFRVRGSETGGAEVDLIAEGAHLHFSRWIFQCKNTGQVALSDLAKEVGMAVVLRAHVIVMATTGRFASTYQDYIKELLYVSHLQVVLLEGPILNQYRTRGQSALLEYFHEKAGDTMKLKKAQLGAELVS